MAKLCWKSIDLLNFHSQNAINWILDLFPFSYFKLNDTRKYELLFSRLNLTV